MEAAGNQREGIDPAVASPARVYDYWLGGKDNYEADRALGDQMMAIWPCAPVGARENRGFLRRAVAHMAGQGVDQFLDIGTGLPTRENVHEVARRINPAARVVYIDNDPVVITHASALLATSRWVVTFEADLREPDKILDLARGHLDLGRPVALLLIAVMHFISDEERPYEIVRTLLDALPTGSYLLLSQATGDLAPKEITETSLATYRTKASTALHARTRKETQQFFDGLTMVAPGLVFVPQWQPDPEHTQPPLEQAPIYCGVARKP